MKKIFTIACIAGVLTLVNSGPAAADEEEHEKPENAVNCVNSSRIRSTTVVDDSSIIFYMRGRTTYLNVLPRQCRGLAREGRFSYRSSTGSLCRLDTIRILYSMGSGIREGAACGLGYFQEVTEEEIEMILDKEPTPPQPQPLPPAEPEDMTKESDES
jgi:hypothetical protein